MRLQAKQLRRPLARHQHKITGTHINSNIPKRMQEETKISFKTGRQNLLETVTLEMLAR